MKKIIGVILFAAAVMLIAFNPTDLLRAQTTQHGVTLTWSDTGTGPSAPSSYNVLRSTTSGGENGTPIGVVSIVAPATTPATTYTDSTGTPGQTYFYEVTATNAAGTSGPSNEVTATFLVPPAVPPSPSGLKAAVN